MKKGQRIVDYRVRIFKKNMNNWTGLYKSIEDIHYCCLQGEYLFHDTTELRCFTDENDFFSIYDAL